MSKDLMEEKFKVARERLVTVDMTIDSVIDQLKELQAIIIAEVVTDDDISKYKKFKKVVKRLEELENIA